MGDLHISWTEYHRKIEQLAIKIHQSGWECEQIICLAKGGLRVGDILCRIFDKPLGVLFTSSYAGFSEDNNPPTRSKIIFSQHLSMIESNLAGKILLVDDLVDSGVSLQESINWLRGRYGEDIRELKTAVLWYKSCSVIKPDYYVDYLPDNPWIHQPFERYESITADKLL
ncbi:putative phosphoribosyltransferase [Xenococcus sp. PCC 7305]|uniref:phosphoribosyltransferase n=1 Tax=Xenococcus sp. PCC 7305 TaxID=102125 RepID=UPI0002ACD5BD|nr:putative phosphoribosyltransferase [Xenococcus sp. PCC 7305]